MKQLKIKGRYKGYVSAFGAIGPDLRDQLKSINERSERIALAEQSTNYVVFSNGINPEDVSLAITVDGELLFSGLAGELPSGYDIVDREDLPSFESICDNSDSASVYTILQEWLEDGEFELKVDVSDSFTLADLEVFAFDLEQGDAVSWALFDQADFQIAHTLDHVLVEGKRYQIVGSGDGIDHSTSFMTISDEGKLSPDFILD
jgi:hypothetical protein